MKAYLKKQIERNIRDIVSVGASYPVSDRKSGAELGVITITSVTRDEVRGHVAGESFGWEGREAAFRVPQLTQRGGNLRLDAALATA